MDQYFLLSEKTLAKAGLSAQQKNEPTENLTLPTRREPVQELEQELLEMNKDRQLTAEEKWIRYSQIFNRFFAIYGNKSSTVEPSAGTENQQKLDNFLNLVSNYVPKQFSRKAEALTRHTITTSPERWSNRGELLDANKNVIPNSSILQLIDYSVHRKKNTSLPSGWSEFQALLRKQNVPEEFLVQTPLRETITTKKEEKKRKKSLHLRVQETSQQKKGGNLIPSD